MGSEEQVSVAATIRNLTYHVRPFTRSQTNTSDRVFLPSQLAWRYGESHEVTAELGLIIGVCFRIFCIKPIIIG